MSNIKQEKQRIMEAMSTNEVGTPEYNALIEQYAKILEMESKSRSVSGDTIVKCATYAGLTLFAYFATEFLGLIPRNYIKMPNP